MRFAYFSNALCQILITWGFCDVLCVEKMLQCTLLIYKIFVRLHLLVLLNCFICIFTILKTHIHPFILLNIKHHEIHRKLIQSLPNSFKLPKVWMSVYVWLSEGFLQVCISNKTVIASKPTWCYEDWIGYQSIYDLCSWVGPAVLKLQLVDLKFCASWAQIGALIRCHKLNFLWLTRSPPFSPS